MQWFRRLLVCALCALAFIWLASSLVERPAAEASDDTQPIAQAFLSQLQCPDVPGGVQAAPSRVDKPEGSVNAVIRGMVLPQVRTDANGHPLTESTYICAVYQAFHLEDRSG